MKTFARTMFAVATNTMYPVRSKLAVLVAVVSVVLLANSGRVSAQTYDWSSLSETQLANFTATAQVSVAISGDIAVVGDMFGNSYKGEVKIFERVSAGNWNALATLTASDAAASDNFGTSVGISGDTVLVGAPDDNNGGIRSGSAYVFTRPESGWATTSAETAKLTASDATANDLFGNTVGISGDTVLVGAYGDDDGGSESGSAYLFTKPGGGWATTSTHAAKLTASDSAADDFFGRSVGISGDTVLVGAHGVNDGGNESGSAYLFTKPGGGWTTTSTHAAKLTASDSAEYDYFGQSVAIDGASGRVIVGNSPDNNISLAYVYEAAAVPEPSTGLLSLIGLALLPLWKRNLRRCSLGQSNQKLCGSCCPTLLDF